MTVHDPRFGFIVADPSLRCSITISTSRQCAARETYPIGASKSTGPDRTVTGIPKNPNNDAEKKR